MPKVVLKDISKLSFSVKMGSNLVKADTASYPDGNTGTCDKLKKHRHNRHFLRGYKGWRKEGGAKRTK